MNSSWNITNETQERYENIVFVRVEQKKQNLQRTQRIDGSPLQGAIGKLSRFYILITRMRVDFFFDFFFILSTAQCTMIS